jgi:hypothetical protein
LVAVGRYSPTLIERFKRTDPYSVDDYQRLEGHLGAALELLTTPHILTEVSNLLGQLAEPARGGCRRSLAAMVSDLRERAEPAAALVASKLFAPIGITDAAIEHLAGPELTLVTDDFQLGGILEKRGVDVWNLRRIRSEL